MTTLAAGTHNQIAHNKQALHN